MRAKNTTPLRHGQSLCHYAPSSNRSQSQSQPREKNCYDKHVGLVNLVLAVLTVTITHDRQLGPLADLPLAGGGLGWRMAALPWVAALPPHRATVDHRFKNEDKAKMLVSKEDVKALQMSKGHNKVLTGGSSYCFSHILHIRGQPYIPKRYFFFEDTGEGKEKSRQPFNFRASAGKHQGTYGLKPLRQVKPCGIMSLLELHNNLLFLFCGEALRLASRNARIG